MQKIYHKKIQSFTVSAPILPISSLFLFFFSFPLNITSKSSNLENITQIVVMVNFPLAILSIRNFHTKWPQSFRFIR